MRRAVLTVTVCLLVLLPAGAHAAAAGFGDVAPASPHAHAIAVLSESGITSGCAEGRFCPRASVTRDQMASFLARALRLDPRAPTGRFHDVALGSTHAGAIEALAAAGVTGGCADARFCPRRPVTRDQMASFLARAFDLPASSAVRFADVAPTNPHAGAVNALAAAGVTGGCADGRFCPRQPVSRDQMASFLVRGLDLGTTPGHDHEDDSHDPSPTCGHLPDPSHAGHEPTHVGVAFALPWMAAWVRGRRVSGEAERLPVPDPG